MGHTAKPYSTPHKMPARHLIFDARKLVMRYALRNEPSRSLTAEQRKAWAFEAVAVLEALTDALQQQLGTSYGRHDREIELNTWEYEFRNGHRFVKPIEQDRKGFR